MTVYAFRGGPEYRGATRDELITTALDQPLSLGSTLWDQAKGGVLESFGLGTAVRELSLPEPAPTEPGRILQPEDGSAIVLPDTPQMRRRQVIQGIDVPQETPQQLEQRRQDVKALTEEQYKASPYYRQNIPWDAGMTEDRAATLATWDDAKQVRAFYAEKRPFTSFLGNLAGQALDPINYIPVAGPLVKAAALARFGKIGGTAIVGALDAAGNTAAASLATRDARASFGNDVSWQSTVSEIATAALIGGAFGTIGGVLGRRADARIKAEVGERLSTLKTTQEARIALNEAIDGLVRGEDIRLSPNATEPMARVVASDLSLAPLDDPRFSARLDMRAIRPDDVSGSIREFADAASKGGRPNLVLSLGETSDASVAAANTAGVDIRGYTRLIEAERVVHVLREHGNAETELPRGQLPVTIDDIARIPDIVEAPDSVTRTKGRRDEDAILYQKRIGDDFYYVETIRRGRKRLGLSTMWKRPGKGEGGSYPAGSDANGPGSLTPKNETGFAPTRNISDVAPQGKVSELEPSFAEPRTIDTSTPRPDPIPEGRTQAEMTVGKTEDYKAAAAQYRVDPETGSYLEEPEIAQVAAEGRLTAEDEATLADAQATYENGVAYGDALKAALGCII